VQSSIWRSRRTFATDGNRAEYCLLLQCRVLLSELGAGSRRGVRVEVGVRARKAQKVWVPRFSMERGCPTTVSFHRPRSQSPKCQTTYCIFSATRVGWACKESHSRAHQTTNRQPRPDPCPSIFIIIHQAQFAVPCPLAAFIIAHLSHPKNLVGFSSCACAPSFLLHKLNQPFIHSAFFNH
jgi:hypothetical protein